MEKEIVYRCRITNMYEVEASVSMEFRLTKKNVKKKKKIRGRNMIFRTILLMKT